MKAHADIELLFSLRGGIGFAIDWLSPN